MPRCPYCNETVDIQLVRSLSVEEIQYMLDRIDYMRLTGDAFDFYQQVRERLQKWGDKTKITVPQRKWLSDLAKQYPAISPDRPPTARIPLEASDEF